VVTPDIVRANSSNLKKCVPSHPSVFVIFTEKNTKKQKKIKTKQKRPKMRRSEKKGY